MANKRRVVVADTDAEATIQVSTSPKYRVGVFHDDFDVLIRRFQNA